MDETGDVVVEKVGDISDAGDRNDVTAEVLPSVDANQITADSNLGGNPSKVTENVQRRKRPRRKSKKGKYPYNKTAWQRKKEQERTSSERAQRVRQMMFAHGQPVAPYNTNQFLMEDHAQNIDTQIQVAQDQLPGSSLLNYTKTSRARDSSFSIDSEEDHFYSSPEDEEEFLTKEFSNAYEDVHVERLNAMTKTEIIHDYIQLESKYEKSMIEIRRLKRNLGEDAVGEGVQGEERPGVEEPDRDTDASSKSDNELTEQLRVSQLENKSLRVELEELRKENKTLHALLEKNQSSTVDSESDSSSSTISSDGSSSDSDDNMDSAADGETANLTEPINGETDFASLNGHTPEEDDAKNFEPEK